MASWHEFGPLVGPRGGEEQWRFTPRQRFAPVFSPGGPAEATFDPVPSERLVIDPGASPAELLTLAINERNLHRPIQVEFGADSQSAVVLDLTGGGAQVIDLAIRVGDRARATVALVGSWDSDAVRLGRIQIDVGAGAELVGCVWVSGGGAVRFVTTARFSGPGGSIDLIGSSLTGPDEHHQHRLAIEHDEPNCRSRVEYKSVLGGRGAHAVWVGDVRIGPRARGTDTFEINRNLMLTKGGRADSVPNLEIETGDVARAGHASATGRLDDDQLFYLLSRGLAPPAARVLVVRGFLAGVLERVPDPTVRELIRARLESRLDSGLEGLEGTGNEEGTP